MIIFKEKKSLSFYLDSLRKEGLKIGFVPTMGALHQGHLSLIQAASEVSDMVVCSIFVNPAQFNDPRDFEKYPVRTEEDIQKLLGTSTGILFLPSVPEIYGETMDGLETYPFGDLENILEGTFRPGHFQGVGRVMSRLLKIVRPDTLFMGQKDFQQTLIVSKLLNILNINIKLIICPVIREKDGLAMSSRNLRLSESARKKAPVIHRTLSFVKENFRNQPFPELLEKGKAFLEKEGFKVEYLIIADRLRLETLREPIKDPMLCLTAAWLDGIRLIDNVFL